MRITTQGDYALRCVLNIARHSQAGPVSIKSMAREEGLPLDYIEQLLLKLRRRKLIKSIRGAKGGYLLEKAIGRMNIRDILDAVEGATFEMICSRRKKLNSHKCKGASACVLKNVWLRLKDKIEEYLTGVTIESLLNKEES